MSSSDCIYGINTVGPTQRGSSGGSGYFRLDHFTVVVLHIFKGSFQRDVLEVPASSGVPWRFGVVRDRDTAVSTAASVPFSGKLKEHAGGQYRWSMHRQVDTNRDNWCFPFPDLLVLPSSSVKTTTKP